MEIYAPSFLTGVTLSFKILRLPDNHVGFISAVDDVWIKLYQWYVNIDQRGKAYICRYEGGKRIYMHREITGCPADMVVDHINGNSLDNRRINLRVCFKNENARNHAGRGDGEFKGVTVEVRAGKRKVYRARISESTVSADIHLGFADTPEGAAELYDKAALIFHGEFAWLNNPVNVTQKEDHDTETPF